MTLAHIKRYVKLTSLFGALLVFMLPLSLSKHTRAEVKIDDAPMKLVYAEGYQPFSWRGKDQSIHGILISVLDELLVKRLKIKVVHEACPWARCQLLVKEGNADAFFTIPNETRRTYTKVTRHPLLVSDFILFTGSNNKNLDKLKRINSLLELKADPDLSHAYIIGGGWHIKNLEGVKKVELVKNSTQVLEILAINHADVYVEQAALVNYQIKEIGLNGQITAIPNVMDTTNWHLCIGKTSPHIDIVDRVDELIKELKDKREFDQIIAKVKAQYF